MDRQEIAKAFYEGELTPVGSDMVSGSDEDAIRISAVCDEGSIQVLVGVVSEDHPICLLDVKGERPVVLAGRDRVLVLYMYKGDVHMVSFNENLEYESDLVPCYKDMLEAIIDLSDD